MRKGRRNNFVLEQIRVGCPLPSASRACQSMATQCALQSRVRQKNPQNFIIATRKFYSHGIAAKELSRIFAHSWSLRTRAFAPCLGETRTLTPLHAHSRQTYRLLGQTPFKQLGSHRPPLLPPLLLSLRMRASVWAHVEAPLEKWRNERLAQKFRCQLIYTPCSIYSQCPDPSCGPPRHVRTKPTHTASCSCWLAGLLFCFFVFLGRKPRSRQQDSVNGLIIQAGLIIGRFSSLCSF